MEVSFAYGSDAGRTWFLIQESQQPVSGGALATWDTTTLTDGDYDLRLLVSLKDGTQQQVVVKGLRVRNYTPVEASSPTVTPLVSATPRRRHDGPYRHAYHHAHPAHGHAPAAQLGPAHPRGLLHQPGAGRRHRPVIIPGLRGLFGDEGPA
jgi:hypothetical protein